MKRTIPLFLLLVLTLSCRKDENLNTLKPEVIFGDYSNMNTTYIDTIITGTYPNSGSLEIDLNKDGVVDISFSAYTSGANGAGYYSTSYIATANENLSFYGDKFQDTTYFSRDTSITNYGQVVIDYYEFHTCYKRTEVDSIESIEANKFYTSQNTNGEILDKNGIFSKTVTYFAGGGSPNLNPVAIGGNVDTIIYLNKRYFTNCRSFETNKISYVGFKLLVDETEKYGWIKFVILNSVKIMILEYSIER